MSKIIDAKILDTRPENSSVCYLVKILLQDYIENLPKDYKDYDIQREIVANSYLDDLLSTVVAKTHIPPIVLIIDSNSDIVNGILKISSFKILDGLQRTFRLNAIWKTMKFFLREFENNDELIYISKYQLSKNYSKRLIAEDSNTKIFQAVIDFYIANKGVKNFNLLSGFSDNYQWFEIWSGLSPKEEVSKMLVLNAGHKPVKIKHQLELIFRNLLPELRKLGIENFEIVREKEESSIQFSKNRDIGSFHFSSIIASLLSLREGKPVITNSNTIQELQNKDFDTESDTKYFEFTFLKSFINSLVEIDKIIYNNFKEEGKRWFGREVTLVGIYGALGKAINNGEVNLEDACELLEKIIKSNPGNLDLKEFEKARNTLDLSKVNFGNVNKNAVFKAFDYIIKEKKLNKVIDWASLFQQK